MNKLSHGPQEDVKKDRMAIKKLLKVEHDATKLRADSPPEPVGEALMS
jgi:hypothetical protein